MYHFYIIIVWSSFFQTLLIQGLWGRLEQPSKLALMWETTFSGKRSLFLESLKSCHFIANTAFCTVKSMQGILKVGWIWMVLYFVKERKNLKNFFMCVARNQSTWRKFYSKFWIMNFSSKRFSKYPFLVKYSQFMFFALSNQPYHMRIQNTNLEAARGASRLNAPFVHFVHSSIK